MTITTKIFRALTILFILYCGTLILIKASQAKHDLYGSTNPRKIIIKDLTDIKKSYKVRQILGQSNQKYSC